MGDQFDWQADDQLNANSPSSLLQPAVSWNPLPFWLGAGLVLALLLAGWGIGRSRLAQLDHMRQTAVQAVIDQERAALLAGDGERFMAYLANDPAWQAAQLLPLNQAAQRAGLAVTEVRQRDETLAASLSWQAGEQRLHRISFFRQEAGQLLHVPSDPAFWGAQRRRETTWGTLLFYEADAPYADLLVEAVTDAILDVCADRCVGGRLPLTLVVRDDFAETAVPNTLHVPSPRLVAINDAGWPAAAFWFDLQTRLRGYLAPATIRFALPPQNFLGLHVVDYEQAAAEFMALHPDITVELVTLPRLPVDARELAAFDGAAILPSPELITAGLVRDLTDWVATDPDFRPGDFYDQIWQGTGWLDRTWVVPQAAAMKLVFYERSLYRQAGIAEPSLRWTWAEMTAHLEQLRDALADLERPSWQVLFLDESLDTLYAYALNHPRCTAAGSCLAPGAVADALAWYRDLVQTPGMTPDLASLPPDERNGRDHGWGTIWVNDLVYYEHRLLLMENMGVVPFPGSPQFDGVSPLWIQGSFMSQQTPYPRAVWTWLTFLSAYPSLPRYRLLPARPSVAEATRYWQTLPRPLNEAMRAGFPFARAVRLDERARFRWEQLAGVIANRQTPEAAAQPQAIRWFGESE